MSFFGKKLVFKYKKEIDSETGKEIKYPIANIILKGYNEEKFETAAIIDSGSDIFFISEEVAAILNLKLGEEETADVLGGGKIKVKPSKVNIVFVRGKNRIDLGLIPVGVGVGISGKETSMDIVIGRNPLFEYFKIIFEQNKKIVTFEKVDSKWYPY